MKEELTIAIVHGAFADASSWNEVIERLQQQDYATSSLFRPIRYVAFASLTPLTSRAFSTSSTVRSCS